MSAPQHLFFDDNDLPITPPSSSLYYIPSQEYNTPVKRPISLTVTQQPLKPQKPNRKHNEQLPFEEESVENDILQPFIANQKPMRPLKSQCTKPSVLPNIKYPKSKLQTNGEDVYGFSRKELEVRVSLLTNNKLDGFKMFELRDMLVTSNPSQYYYGNVTNQTKKRDNDELAYYHSVEYLDYVRNLKQYYMNLRRKN